MTKTRRKSAADLTKTQIGEAVERYAHARARFDHLTAKMNKDIDAVRDRYAEQLEAHQQTMTEQEAVCEKWSKANRQIEFNGKQSLEFTHGTLVFRLGNVFVKLPAKVTEEDVVKRLDVIDGCEKYIRVQPRQVNREALIADRKILSPEIISQIGVTFPQKERFCVEPRLDDPVPAGN